MQMGMLDLFREWQRKVDNRLRPRLRRGVERSEELELRRMLSAIVVGTTLTVDADPNPVNQIAITQNSSGVSVDENGTITQFDPSVTINTIKVNGNFGDDFITVNSLFNTTSFSANGGGGNNSLIAPSGINDWFITGANSGQWNGNPFSNMQNLVGGIFNDSFRFVPTGVISGMIDGGGGIDRLDYSALTSGVTVDLTAHSATAIGVGFDHISDFIGSSDNTDRLTGPNTANTWQITGGNRGNINQQQFYSSFENITGGASSDLFAFVPGGFQSGNISGGLGNNTIDYSQLTSGVSTNLQFSASTGIGGSFSLIGRVIGSSAGTDLLTGANDNNNWLINGPNAGTFQSLSFATNFAGYENLMGGNSFDTFKFAPGGFISGKLHGNAGQNTIDYSQLASGIVLNLQTNTTTAVGGGFLNVQSLVGSSSTNSANYDTLIGTNTTTTWNITGANAGNVNGTFFYRSVENLAGGTASDTFAVTGGFVSGTVRGGTGAITNTLDYSQGFGGSQVNLQTGAATGIGGGIGQIQNLIGKDSNDVGNFDTLIGANTQNTWNILAKNSGNINGTFTFTGIENLTGGSNPDVFRLNGGTFVSGTINGDANRNGGDWLDYTSFITAVNVNLAAGTGTGVGSVVNIQNVHGGEGVNTLAGNSLGNVLVGGQANDSIVGGTGRNLLIGGAGADVVTGNTNEDIVISSYTAYDANLSALSSILAEWQSSNTFDQRVSHLRNGGGLNGKNVLIADSTVFNDGTPDVISGYITGTGPGGRNWMWGQPAELQNTTPLDVIDTPINNPPILSGDTSLVYTAKQGGVPVNPIITIFDLDSTTLASATVKITNNYNSSQDSLGFISSAATGNITGSFNSTTGTLTLTSLFATATVAQFQTALRSVTYSNSSSQPTTAPRTIVYQAFDGKAYSNTVSTPVYFNFAPSLSGSSSIVYASFQGPTVINSNITVSDPNSITLSYATVSLSNIFFPTEDVLGFVGSAATGDLVGSYNNATGVLTITSAGALGTLANYQAALRSVTYNNTGSPPSKFTRTVSYQVNDGNVFSNTVNSTVTVV
jgi:hypothetical protein